MKLYLSSLRIPQPKPFLKLFKRRPLHIALIPTACTTPAAQKNEYIHETNNMLAALKCTADVIHVEDYEHNPTALHVKLREFSGCWVMGGNTFHLNYWLARSGFDAILPHLLADGFVYAGESAGAVVAGKTLHGIELLDNPADAPEVIWKGLGLVDYGIIPHWGDPQYAERMQQTYDEMRLFGAVKTLTNNDIIVVS